MNRTLFSLLLGASLALASTAHAQRQAPRSHEAPPAPSQRFDFDNDEVVGTLANAPDSGDVESRQRSKHSSLIKLRQEFDRELYATAENL
jgi:hypothetical protein